MQLHGKFPVSANECRHVCATVQVTVVMLFAEILRESGPTLIQRSFRNGETADALARTLRGFFDDVSVNDWRIHIY